MRACAPLPATSVDRATFGSREREVTALVTAGESNRKIATTPVLPERTAHINAQHSLTTLRFTKYGQITVVVRKNPGH